MEDRVSWIKGVKLVMFITHDHDDCLMINGGFGGRVATRFTAKLEMLLLGCDTIILGETTTKRNPIVCM
jgi:hypothetical protein